MRTIYQKLALENSFAFHSRLFWGYIFILVTGEESCLERDPSTITIVPFATEGGRAVGDDCTNPIIVSVPAALPYNNANYTCGRGNTYSLPSTECMSYYTSGEDLIYRLDVTVNTTITLTMNPGPTSYPGMGIFSGCPAVGNCIAAATNYCSSSTGNIRC